MEERTMRHIAAALCITLSAWCPGALADEDSPIRGDLEDTAPGVAASAAAADDPMESLRALVDREANRLVGQLEAEESTRDWSVFLEHKCTADAAFLPAWLAMDALAMVAADPPPDLLRALRVEWRDEPAASTWSSARAEARARSATACWAPPPGGATLRIEARTAACRWAGTDAPPLIRWTVDATHGRAGPSVHARAWWRVPIAEPSRVDFPLEATGLDLWFDGAGARLHDDDGNTHSERWPDEPMFANPPELYAAFDALRSVSARDQAVRAGAPEGRDAGPDGVATRTVRRHDGSLLRTERWRWTDGVLSDVVIDQAPLRIVHHAPRAFDVVTEVDGAAGRRERVRPRSELVQFPAGMRIEVLFRRPDPDRDRVPTDRPDAAVPDRVTLSVDGRPRAWASFDAVRWITTERTDDPDAERTDPLRRESSLHRALARGIEQAIADRSPGGVAAAAESVASRLHEMDAPLAQQAAEWELVAERLHHAGLSTEADLVLAGRWAAVVDAEAAIGAVERWRSAGHGEFANRLAVIAGLPTAAVADASAERAPTCTGDRLQDGARLLFDAVTGAVRTHAPPDDRPMLRDAVCAAFDDAADRLRSVDASTAARIGADARAALRAGLGTATPDDLAADSDDAAATAARRFAERCVGAATRPLPTASESERLRTAWDRCATGVEDALRATLRASNDGEWPDLADEVRRALRERRQLVGNAFFPELDAPGAGTPPSAAEVHRAVAPMVDTVIQRERRRSGVLSAMLPGPLAESRRAVARRRVVETAVDAAIAEYQRWQSAAPENGTGRTARASRPPSGPCASSPTFSNGEPRATPQRAEFPGPLPEGNRTRDVTVRCRGGPRKRFVRLSRADGRESTDSVRPVRPGRVRRASAAG